MKIHPSYRMRKASSLVEVSFGMGVFLFVALLVSTLQLLCFRTERWIVMQTCSDALLSIQVSQAESLKIKELLADNVNWPMSTAAASPTRAVIVASRQLVQNGSQTQVNYEVSSKSYRQQDTSTGTHYFHMIVSYPIGSRTYYKTRTVARNE